MHTPVTAPAARQRRPVRLTLLAALLHASLAAAQATALPPPQLTQVTGRVELLSAQGTWIPQDTAAPVTHGLRTGTGRATVLSGPLKGSVLLGSASSARRYRDEVDLQEGHVLLRGPVAVHARGVHVSVTGSGRARVDLDAGRTARIAVLSGEARVALAGRTVTVRSGQQLALGSGQLSAFRESDPWYEAVFRGAGEATVQATRGPVSVQQGQTRRTALIGDALQAGQRLTTGAAAWAEVGFTGGGYLRLDAHSELEVLTVDRTSQGREVQLRLARGSAWNVVQRGQGGYRLDTPVVSTAVRGTKFRVDASGLVKVIEGQVTLPSQADQPVGAGQQREPGGTVAPLHLDDLDRRNQALDAERSRPLTLTLHGQPTGTLDVTATSAPGARLQARLLPGTLDTTTGDAPPLRDVPGENGTYTLSRPDLPEGRYRLEVLAALSGRQRRQAVTITVDRTPPHLSGAQATRTGHVLTLRGVPQDTLSARVQLSVTVNGRTYRRTLPTGQPFQWVLPAPATPVPLTLSVRDAAGNETHVPLP